MTSPASDSLTVIWERLDSRIRRVDEERWLSSRYAPGPTRRTLIVLYAFYYELARVRVSVTDPTMGQIRFQWWRDALRELAQGQQRQHDVVLALAEEIAARRLDPDRLLTLVARFETAFLESDRNKEPEDELAIQAAKIVSEPEAEIAFDAGIPAQWARLRRGEAVVQPSPRVRIASPLRPALAHLRLRHLWVRGRKVGRVQARLSIFMAVLTGQI